LSSASLAFEMSSRRKMSLLEYKEWMMMSIRRLTSASKRNSWAPARGARWRDRLWASLRAW
jgi:hypothetical protein